LIKSSQSHILLSNKTKKLIFRTHHNLFIRAKDENGLWSITARKVFFKMENATLPDASKIKAIQYFVDADPGIAQRKLLEISPGTENLSDFAFNIDISQYSFGLHSFSVLAVDENNAVSIIKRQQFFKEKIADLSDKVIDKLEYYIDADPGYGKGFNIPIESAATEVLFEGMLALPQNMNTGFHYLNIRARDEKGKWSTVNRKMFFFTKETVIGSNNIVYANYAIDNATPIEIPIDAVSENVSLEFVADISSLSVGFHWLNIKAKDQFGRWSINARKPFYKGSVPVTQNNDIAYIEYFIDEDKGFGKNVPITGFSKSSDLADFNFAVNLPTDLADGMHSLYIRVRDSKGKYTLVSKRPFFKQKAISSVLPQITKVEYFINSEGVNNDAGLGQNSLVADLPVSDHIQDHIFSVDLTGKAKGTYTLWARAWDSKGQFSYEAVDTFKVCDNVARANFVYEQLGLKVLFTDLSELATTYKWNFGNGATSTEGNPVYTYPSNGTYNVCLTVTNDCNSATFCDEITVSFNNPPTAVSKTVTIDENKEYKVSIADFGYNDLDGNPLKKIKIANNPVFQTGDSLVLTKTFLTAGMEINAADLSKIRFKPALGVSGNARASFNFQVFDGVDYSTAYTFTFNVNGINNPPTFEISTNTINVLQNSGAKTITDWITQLLDNDPDEVQNLLFEISESGNSGLFSQFPAVFDNKDLKFTVNAGVTGVANLTVKLNEQSTYQQPLNQSVSKTFSIAVKEFKAALAADKQEVCTGSQVTFSSSSPSDGVTFAWEFGTGATPSTFNGAVPPPVVYATSGTKTIKLTITAGSQTDNKTIDITVLQSPNAEFTTETDSYALNSEVTFTNSSAAGQTYEWDWGDGTAKVTTTDLSEVKHTFNSAGETKFTITLKATNGICTDVFSKELNFVSASPPTIVATSFTEALNDGQTKTISVQATDQKGLLKAIFYYKGISETAYKSKTLNTLNSLFETDLTQALGDEIGITYYFDVYNIVGLKTKSVVGNTYINYNKGVEVPFLQFGVTVDKYQIVSMPLKLKDNKISTIFDELGEYDKAQWRLLNYSPDKLLEYQTDFDVMDRGKGYWFIARNSATLNTGEGATADPGSFTEFEIALRKGWTQIGNPYNFDVSWSDIKIHNPTASSFIENLKEFRNGSFIESNTLKKFSGGFVYSSASGVTLKIPLKKASTKKTEQVLLPINLEEPNWKLNLNLQNGAILNTLSGIGMNLQASALHDEYDQMAVPRFIQYLEGVFMHPDAEYRRFAKDVVPTADSHVWEFIVSNTFENELVTLTWNELLPGNNKLILFDVTNQRQVDMQQVSSYTFTASESSVFKIFFGTEENIKENLKPELYFLGQAYPNPSNGLTYIPFTVPESDKEAMVELSVYDMVGKKVATLVNQKIQPGFHEATWSGDVQNGMYLYKLTINNRNISLSGKLAIAK